MQPRYLLAISNHVRRTNHQPCYLVANSNQQPSMLPSSQQKPCWIKQQPALIPINQQQPTKVYETDTVHVMNQQQGKNVESLKENPSGTRGRRVNKHYYLNQHTLNILYPDNVRHLENAHRDLRDKVQRTPTVNEIIFRIDINVSVSGLKNLSQKYST